MALLPQDTVDKILKKALPASDVSFSSDKLEELGSEENVREIYQNMAAYTKMLEEKITFITPGLSSKIPFTRENLYLLAAYSGSGKTTLAANISYSLWKECKKTVVISNEESKQDILMRIACIDEGASFNDFKKGLMPQDIKLACAVKIPEIIKYVKVIDVNYQDGITTSVEGVKNILEEIKDKDFSCVMIDYWQLIKRSNASPNGKPYDILNDLRIWLGQYIKRANLPIVMFAQLHSIGKRQNKDLDSRIKHCPDIYEPSTVVIEVAPNWENKTTELIIHKDRFGLAGSRVLLAFDKGRFIDSNQETIRKIQEEKAQELNNKIGDVGDAV